MFSSIGNSILAVTYKIEERARKALWCVVGVKVCFVELGLLLEWKIKFSFKDVALSVLRNLHKMLKKKQKNQAVHDLLF